MKFSALSTLVLAFFFFSLAQQSFAQTKIEVETFHKVIISPHIEVTFKQGRDEEVIITDIETSMDKFHAEVKKGVLHLYLEGASTTAKPGKDLEEEISGDRSKYHGTIVTAVVIYEDLESLSLRGEENHLLESAINQEEFELDIYGESDVLIEEIEVDWLKAISYGESRLVLEEGAIEEQKFTAYGESQIDASAIESQVTRIKAYGDGEYRIWAEDKLHVTSFGEATVYYKGNPEIKKGIVIGETKIQRIDAQ